MLVQLPNGFFDVPDLYNFAEVDELRGAQQNYLADKDLVVGNIGHVPKILKDLVLNFQTKEGLVWKGKIEEAIEKLPIGDIETLFIKIRENTYGPRFYHEATCEKCNHVNKNLRLNLDELKLDVMPQEELLKPKILNLPKSKQEVELKALYLKDLFEIIKINQSKHNSLITSTVCTTVKRIGNKSPVTSKDLETMSAMDLDFIAEKVGETKLFGTIDTAVDICCSKCKTDFQIKLNVFDPNFFSPLKESTNTNM